MHERDIDAYDNEMYSGHPDIPTEMWVFYAFPPEIRRQIGKRDKWHCQAWGCDKSYQGGWMVEIHHRTPEAQAKKEGWTESQINDPSNGVTLCLHHHQLAHEQLGDYRGAKLIENRIKQSGEHHHGYVVYEATS